MAPIILVSNSCLIPVSKTIMVYSHYLVTNCQDCNYVKPWSWDSFFSVINCHDFNDVFIPAPSISLRRHRDSIRVPWFVSERVLMSWTLCLPPKLESLKVQLKLQEFPCRVQSSIFLHVLNPWPPRLVCQLCVNNLTPRHPRLTIQEK